MDLKRSYIFIVFIVMLIHEVVFSECDLNTKTHNHLIKSYVDGFQRKERQAPIDPSRMYLPPKVDSVASTGFGDENIEAANNFGDNAADGYGEVALVHDTSSDATGGQQVASADNGGGISSYGVPTKTADYGPLQGGAGVPETGSGFDGASSGQKTAGVAAPDRNNFGRYVQNKNTGGDNNNSYGGGGGDELLSTAQNRGPIGNGDNNYDNHRSGQGAGGGGGGSATGSGQNAAGARQYGGYRFTTASSVPASSQNGGARNSYGQRGDGGDASPKRDRAFTTAGYGNTLPNSSDRKPAAPGYGNAGAGGSYDPSAATVGGSGGFPSGSDTGSNDLQTGPPSQSAAATSHTDGGNGAGNYGGNDWSAAGYQGGYNRGESDSPFATGYGLTSSGSGLDQGTSSSNRDGGFNSNGPSRGSDNYGPTAGSAETANADNYYGRIPSDGGSNNAYNGQGGGSSSALSQNGYDQQSYEAYGQSEGLSQSLKSGGNSDHGQSSVPANGGYDQQIPTNGQSGFDHSQRGTSQVLNNYGPTESQLLPSSRNSYDQRGSSNGPNGYGLAGSQIFPSTKDDYSQNSQNSLSYGGYTRGSSNPTQTSERNNNAQIDTPGNGLPTRGSVQGSTSSSSGLSQPCHSCSSKSTRPLTDSRNESQNKKKYSTIVPKTQYQNSNLPSNDQVKQGNDIQNTNNNGNFGQPGPNAFSNFAPGNLPNSPNSLNSDPGDLGQPGPNAFSNFAPGNLPNSPNNLNSDPGDLGQPGPNAFSNFAPSTQLNPPINNDNGDFGQPSSNAFSNFAPGNRPNPSINSNKNNCGSNNHDNNGNTQYESAFSAPNTGY